jgi:dTDP-4-dehydrorhamnose reductase
LNVYGRSKAAGEQAVAAACSRAYIARTAWVMNPRRPGFLAAMLKAAERGTARVARQTSSPTGLADLVEALDIMLQRRPPYGIYHLVNAGWCSRREMADTIFQQVGADVVVEEVSIAEFGGAPRPAFSALASPAWAAAGLPPFRPWQQALAETLRAIGG